MTQTHKQKYHKRENRSVNRSNLTEIVGKRDELIPFLGEIINCEVFVTNSLGYQGDKRLLTEVRIPKTNFYIRHLWVKEYNLPIDKIQHGYQKVKLKVISYDDQVTGDKKYGVKIADEKVKAKRPKAKMVIPKWKLEQIKNEKLTKSKTPKTKSPFGKIRKIKGSK